MCHGRWAGSRSFAALDMAAGGVGKTTRETALEGHRTCEELFEGLSLIADGETEEVQCQQALAHVGECEPCRRYLESLQATRGALGQAANATQIGASELEALLAQCHEALRAKMPDIFPASSSK